MKKTLTILAASVAMVCTASVVNAQSTFTNQEGKAKKETVSPKEKANAQAKPVSSEEKSQMMAEKQKAEQMKKIEHMEAKIKANENNPNVDLTEARKELARMKKEAGVKDEEDKAAKKK